MASHLVRDILLAGVFAALVGVVLFVFRHELFPGDAPPRPAEVLERDSIPGAYVGAAPALVRGDPLAPSDPQGLLVIIYNHGSIDSQDPWGCEPGELAPPVLSELAGEEVLGRRIAVYDFCSHVRVGREDAPALYGSDTALEQRTEDIESLVATFLAAGLPPENVFLAGQSQGAWASLQVARRRNVDFNGVVAFAPAFAGYREDRPVAYWRTQGKQQDRFEESGGLPALIFAFERDSFNEVEDLAFFAGIPGVTFLPLSGRVIEGLSCGTEDPHFTAHMDCFRRTQKPVIRDFLRSRLAQ